MRTLIRSVLGCLALAAASPALGLQAGPAAPVALPAADDPDEIVVSALRIPREKLPTGVYWSYPTILASRITRENADMFMRCALNIARSDWLLEVVDGEPNSADARFFQARISAASAGCYPPLRTSGLMLTAANTPINVVPNVGAVDRGAIIDSVLRTYAPDAALTIEATQDPVVRARFVAREGVRNRLRLPADRDGLVLAACLVREQPEFATRLVKSPPGSQLERGLTQAILVDGRSCLAGAQSVSIDPTFFRTYLSDAYYRWVVAARGVDSLIPVQIASR